MKNRQLEVDFIGGNSPLTKEEETMISNFILSQQKHIRNKSGNTVRKQLSFA
jgi:hypothetical protein